jgi:hypothetical protein
MHEHSLGGIELRILTTGILKGAFRSIAAEFERQTGHRVTMSWRPSSGSSPEASPVRVRGGALRGVDAEPIQQRTMPSNGPVPPQRRISERGKARLRMAAGLLKLRGPCDALVACAGVTLNAVATALGIELRDASLQAEGDLDFRGTLGLSKEVPVGFQNIRLAFTLDTDASEEQLATLLRLTERYCVVYQTLSHPPALAVHRKQATA